MYAKLASNLQFSCHGLQSLWVTSLHPTHILLYYYYCCLLLLLFKFIQVYNTFWLLLFLFFLRKFPNLRKQKYFK